MGRLLRIILVVVAVVVVASVLAGLWAIHHVDRYLPRVTAYIQKNTGKQVEIGHAEVTLFPLIVRLYDVAIPNPKPFPAGYFLKAPQVEAALQVVPLLHGTIAVRSLVLDGPVIDFISDPDGLWNFQNPGGPKQATKKMRFSMGSIASLRIEKGTLLGSALIDPADTPGPVVLEIDDFSAAIRQIDFGAFKKASNTTVAGHLDADGARFGDIHVTNLHSGLLVAPERMTLKKFQAKTYRGQASGDFTINLAGQNPTFNSDLQMSGVGVPYLLGEFESGPAKMTGMMAAQLTVGGEIAHTANPLAGVHGAGTFIVRNGELPSLNGNKSMAEMKRFRNASAGAKPVSAFSQFAGDVELKDRRIYNKKIGVDFYGINVDGGGSLNEVSGALDYRGAAIILKQPGFFISTVARMFKGAEEKNGKLTFPIRLTGTLSRPQFSVAK